MGRPVYRVKAYMYRNETAAETMIDGSKRTFLSTSLDWASCGQAQKLQSSCSEASEGYGRQSGELKNLGACKNMPSSGGPLGCTSKHPSPGWSHNLGTKRFQARHKRLLLSRHQPRICSPFHCERNHPWIYCNFLSCWPTAMDLDFIKQDLTSKTRNSLYNTCVCSSSTTPHFVYQDMVSTIHRQQ